MTQNAISRLENPNYGKPTLTTLKRMASVFDVGLDVRFVPFSKLVNLVTGTSFVETGLSPESFSIPSFASEDGLGVFEPPTQPEAKQLEQGWCLYATAKKLPAKVDREIAKAGMLPASEELAGAMS